MITHDIEGRCKETSDVRSISVITYYAGVSVVLAAVVVEGGIRCIGGCLGITFVFQHADGGETSVGGVGVPFDAEAMRGIAEVPSLDV